MAPVGGEEVEAYTAIPIFYGSQTGTSEEVAWDLAREGRRKGFQCGDPCALDDIDLQTLSKLGVAIFVVSTTGQGDPPLNMRRLWSELVVASLPKTLLSNLCTAVFGLGDSHYREFNYAARKLEARLRGLGAKPFFRLGLGDEQHDFGLEQELDPWAEGMWEALAELVSPRQPEEAPEDSLAVGTECRYEVEELGELVPEEAADNDGDSAAKVLAQNANEFEAVVAENQCLCTDEHTRNEQDVRNLHLVLPPGMAFTAGDVCVVWPQTEPAVVKQFVVETLGRSLHERIRVRRACNSFGVSSANAACVFPDTPLSLEDIFTSYVDINSMPTRHFFHVLSLHTDHDLHRKKLHEFSSRTLEAKDALYEYCKRERRSAREVMWDFWTTKPPLPELLSALPPMRPRRYSIASCPRWRDPHLAPEAAARLWCTYQQSWSSAWRFPMKGDKAVAACSEGLAAEARQRQQQGDSLDLCVAVVEFVTKTGRECQGLCSSFLKQAAVGATIRCSIEPGTLTLPSLEVPLILVCPGTGLSPCRALVQERHIEVCSKAQAGMGRFAAGLKDLMFLGFRHSKGDFLYAEEWHAFGDWLAVHAAFSRDDPERKVYVQDLIEEQGAHVCRLLDAGARIYVCGRSHPMPSQVFDAFAEALHDHRGLPLELAAARLREMQRVQRYICDTWG